MNARFPYLFALALTLPLASCRFVGMKPDFSVMGDALSPVEADSVVVESKPGASTPLAAHTPRPAAAAPAAKPAATPAPASGSQSTSFFSQQQPAALTTALDQRQPTQTTAAQVKLYTVQPGDSLSRIARMHKVPLGSLAGANGIDLQKPLIKPGQQLRIPQGGAAISAPPRSASVPPPAAPQPATAAKPASTAQPTSAAKPAPAPLLTLKPVTPAATPAPAAPAAKPAVTPSPAGTYRVCAGDTLYRIARKHGISLQQLLQANKLNEESARSVRVGTLLTIPTQP